MAVDDNGSAIGNGQLGIELSRDRWRHVTLKGQGRDPNMLSATLSRKWLAIKALFQRIASR